MWRLSCVALTVVVLTLCLGGTTAQQLVTCGTGTCADGWNFAANGYSGYDPTYEGGVIALGTSGAPATSSQTLTTQIGVSYTYSFDLWSYLSNGESFIARWGSTTLLSLTTEFYPSPVTYTHFDFDHAVLRIPTGMLLLAARQRVGDPYPVAVEHALQLAHQLAHPVEHAHELAHELAHQYALIDQHLVPDQLADQQPVGLALWFALALELGLAQQLALALELSLAQPLALAFVQRFAQ